jgi:hypothetical protein
MNFFAMAQMYKLTAKSCASASPCATYSPPFILGLMDGLASVSGATAGGTQGAESSEGLVMLKKTQDLMKQQSSQLLEALPQPAQAPSPPGVGGNIDIRA